MIDSDPRLKLPVPGADAASPVEGHWGLDLWSGGAWFSDWFYGRLHWQAGAHRRKLDDLRPILTDGAWESLLRAIRDHLERQAPLNLCVRVELTDGRIETWRLEGAAERNAWGQPVQVNGSVRVASP